MPPTWKPPAPWRLEPDEIVGFVPADDARREVAGALKCPNCGAPAVLGRRR